MNIEEPQASLALLKEFCDSRRLSPGFAVTAREHYLPFIRSLLNNRLSLPFLVGISGAQGSGKSTLADLVAFYAEAENLNVAAFSLDDFYLSRAEREQLSIKVHPLLRTRGVPGTHDISLLTDTLDSLACLREGQTLAIPRFDKLADDRLPESEWSRVSGTVDMVIFEGWCVGAQPQAIEELRKPINALEEREDTQAHWRNWVNQQLTNDYQKLWSRIDLLAFIRAPDFASVLGWREEQELRLAESSGSNEAPMTRDQLQRFIQHYQRITEHNLDILPDIADVVFSLNREHQIIETSYRDVSISS